MYKEMLPYWLIKNTYLKWLTHLYNRNTSINGRGPEPHAHMKILSEKLHMSA